MKLKRTHFILTMILVVIFTIGISTPVNAIAGFNTYKGDNTETIKEDLLQVDINQINFPVYEDLNGHWADKYMSELSHMEILRGFIDNTMKPNKVITRSEFITMVVRVMDLEDQWKNHSNYLDVPTTHWAYSYINRGKAYGLLDYFNENYFYPNKTITREEMAIILSKALPDDLKVDKYVFFNDIKDDYINKKDIDRVASVGIINGMPDGRFAPKETSSRAEAAAMIYRFIDIESDIQEMKMFDFVREYEENLIKSANVSSTLLKGVIEYSIGKEKYINYARKKVIQTMNDTNIDRSIDDISINVLQNSLYKYVVELRYELIVNNGELKKNKYYIRKNLYITKRDGEFVIYDSVLYYDSIDKIRSDEKINLTWDYIYKKTPDMTETKSINGLNVISPTWFVVLDESLNILDKGDTNYTKWAHEQGYEVWPLFGNGFNKEVTAAILADSDKREKLAEKIIAASIKYDADGINIDFENMRTEDNDEFSLFIKELSKKAREKNLLVSVDVTPINKYSSWSMCYDREELSKYADYIIMMAYDQHWEGSFTSGSVAQLSWVEDSLEKILKEVPKEKLILAVPFYTRLWKETYENGKTVVTSKAISMENAEKAIEDNNGIKIWDEESGQYYAEYKKDGSLYRIWLEDENSIRLKTQLVNKYDIGGVASWRKGFEKPYIWDVIDSIINAASY